MLRVVLDANVFVSAALRPEGPPGRIVERVLRDAAFELALSPAIVDEVLRALAYPHPRVRKFIRGDAEPEFWFEDILVLADLVPGEQDVSGGCLDPDDDKYLAAAVEGRAAFIITGDRQLLALRAYEGVRIVGPVASLEALDAL